jgi:hypothetical protein
MRDSSLCPKGFAAMKRFKHPRQRATVPCVDCRRKPRWGFGRCSQCLQVFKTKNAAEFRLLKALSGSERAAAIEAAARPVIPHFEYENPQGESELMALAEKQEREKNCAA